MNEGFHPKEPPRPPPHKIRKVHVETTKDRLYPKPPPFSAREKYAKLNEERSKPVRSTLVGSPRYKGKFNITGTIEKMPEKPPPDPAMVDAYIEILKKSRPPKEKVYDPQLMLMSEVPYELRGPWTSITSRQSPRHLSQIFDRCERFKPTISSNISDLPTLYVTKKFKHYIDKNGDRVPKSMNNIPWN